MTITLAANVNATIREFELSDPLDQAPGYLFRLDDELVRFIGYKVPLRPRDLDRSRIRVDRGLVPTTSASHTAGATIKGALDGFVNGDDEDEPDPFASGGGSGIPQGGPLTEDLDADGFAITGISPIVQAGPPTQGTNASQYISGVPTGPFTFTINGEDTTSLTGASTTTEMADALSIAATGVTGNVLPYPDYEDYTLDNDEETYVIFVRDLGIQPVTVITCSDGDVSAEDYVEGVAPDPIAVLGQFLINDESYLYQYLYIPEENTGVTAITWVTIWPAEYIESEDDTAKVGATNDGFYSEWNPVSGDSFVSGVVGGSFMYNSVTRVGLGSGAWQLDPGLSAYRRNEATAVISSLYMLEGGIEVGGGAGTERRILSGLVDPTADAGITGPIGSLYSNVTDGTQWSKTGAGDTDWQQLAFVP